MNNHTSVIAAVSTPPGKGGVAIIRISGDGAIEIADKIFYPRSKKPLSSATPRYQVYGDIIFEGDEIDDGMATVFRAPASYTGEDTVEISCHGGTLVTGVILEAILSHGARLAEPGEFTRRAFINGKLSLTEAEAIGTLLEAETREQIKLTSSSSRKIFAERVESIRELLRSALSSMYARIDYPDEDLGDFTTEEMLSMLDEARESISALLATYRTGRSINEGIRAVICGKPNVGKSSLYNLLLDRDAAIVTDIEGTTRDVLREKISLGRVMLTLADTAGVREGLEVDRIEEIGIERTHEAISGAELIFAVFDLSRPYDKEDERLITELSKSNATRIGILNKTDMPKLLDESKILDSFEHIIRISTQEDSSAREEISRLVDKLFTDEKIVVGSDAIVSSARHNAILTSAIRHVDYARGALELGLSQDLASSDIERALGIIAELDGKSVSDEVVGDIFEKFCVGK